MKYYAAANCFNARTGVSGKVYSFEACVLSGGSWTGVFATQAEVEIADLDALASDIKSAVTEISQDDFEKLVRQGAGKGLANGFNVPALTATTRLGLLGLVSDDPSAPSAPPEPPKDSVDEVPVGPVTPAVKPAKTAKTKHA